MMLRASLFALLLSAQVLPNAHAQDALSLDALLSSLMQVQDKIAQGDAGALPVQTHLMKLLDGNIGEIGNDAPLGREEIRALLIFGIIGSGSNAVADVLAGVSANSDDKKLFDAVIDYRKRRRRQAIDRFKLIDEKKLDPRLAPFIAFARGNLLAKRNPKRAMRQYDRVRLLAPGTLLEEATIRRLLTLSVAAKDSNRFMSLAKQYARRFLTSPYRQQYLSVLRRGLMSLHRTIPHHQIEELAGLMPRQFAVALYLHMARSAVIAGHFKLARFGVKKITELAAASDEVRIKTAQLDLLREITRLVEDEPEEVLQKLRLVDETKLDPTDRRLLQAAIDIVSSVLSPIDETMTNTIPKVPSVAGPKQKSSDQHSSDGQGAEGARLAPTKSDNVGNSSDHDDLDRFVRGTQKRLKAIDEILSE